jgi:hypothetical protein
MGEGRGLATAGRAARWCWPSQTGWQVVKLRTSNGDRRHVMALSDGVHVNFPQHQQRVAPHVEQH